VGERLDERVRLKKVHFWRDEEGRVFYAGIKPIESSPEGVVRQGQYTLWSPFDVSNNSSVIHRWFHSVATPSSICFGCAGLFFGAPCGAVAQVPGPAPLSVNAGQAKGFYERNLWRPWSCAIRQVISLYGTYGCFCDGSGGAFINTAASCVSNCCFQNSFSSDFWWNSGDTDSNTLGFCNTGTCPN
jgi:hypothetical protein